MTRTVRLSSLVPRLVLMAILVGLAPKRAQAIALQNTLLLKQKMSADTTGESQQPTKRSEGFILHENTRTGEETLYRFRVMSDTTVRVRQGRSADAPTITLPRLVAFTLSDELEEAFPVDSVRRSAFDIGYEDHALLLRLARSVDLLVLGGLALLILGLGGTAFVFWRRLKKERRRRAAQVRARRHQAEGQEKERRRLAREIHDGPVQDLHGLHMRLAAAEGNGPVGEALMLVTKELRAVSADLRPPALEEFGLAAALRSFADRFRERHPDADVTLQLEFDGEELPERTRLALFRVAQEAMNNAVQHAASEGTCRLTVELGCEDKEAILVVRDDGSGFEVPAHFEALAREGHYGLLGMTERVEALGGEINVCSSLGKGTEVAARVPLLETARSTVISHP